MENSQPLSIESFSYSWLINLKPSLESLDSSLMASLYASDEEEAAFIEMDPTKPPSKRFLREVQDFNFDFPVSPSPLSLVHADQLFSNGLIMPLFVNPLKMGAYDYAASDLILPTSSPNSPDTSSTILSASKIHCSSLKRCRRISKQLLRKYLDFLIRPLYQRFRGGCRSDSRAENVGTRIRAKKNFVYSPDSSPRMNVAYYADDWRKSSDSESSIYDAVLHCKRSIGR